MQLFKSSFLLFVTFDIMLWERYLFEAKLWFFHSQVVSQLPKYLGRVVIANKLDMP